MNRCCVLVFPSFPCNPPQLMIDKGNERIVEAGARKQFLPTNYEPCWGTWMETFLRYLSLEAVWDTIFQLAPQSPWVESVFHHAAETCNDPKNDSLLKLYRLVSVIHLGVVTRRTEVECELKWVSSYVPLPFVLLPILHHMTKGSRSQ